MAADQVIEAVSNNIGTIDWQNTGDVDAWFGEQQRLIDAWSQAYHDAAEQMAGGSLHIHPDAIAKVRDLSSAIGSIAESAKSMDDTHKQVHHPWTE